MWIELFGLSCLLSILEAHQPPAPTLNPECAGMKTATTHLQTGIQMFLHKSANCQPNPHCTGVKCTWSGGGILEIDLHHCDDPVHYHVYLNAPGKVRNETLSLKEGDEKELFKKFKIHVTELSRKGNVVTTTVKLESCVLGPCLPPYTLLHQSFCVRMQNCPGFNASTTHYKPCNYKPTGSPIDHSTERSFRSTPSDYPPTGKFEAHKGKPSKDDPKKLTTAAIIGICAASVFAILIVLAAGVYWKKYHHRSRLRAAYYNDISMHDPLYEDFGPEVA